MDTGRSWNNENYNVRTKIKNRKVGKERGRMGELWTVERTVFIHYKNIGNCTGFNTLVHSLYSL